MDKLEVTFCHQAVEYIPFICSVNGRVTTNELCEIEAEVADNEYDELKQTGLYTFSCSYYPGQYGDMGCAKLPRAGYLT